MVLSISAVLVRIRRRVLRAVKGLEGGDIAGSACGWFVDILLRGFWLGARARKVALRRH